MDRPAQRRKLSAAILARQAFILFVAIALLWALEIADLLHGSMDAYGIRPRTWSGLRQIFVAPLLHVGFGHLMANTIPFLALGWLVMLRRTSDFFVVTVIAALISGTGIWLFGGASTVHLGASGVIFGYLGYLLLLGYFERSLTSVALALIALLFYGGLLWGVLPGSAGVSWLAHLFGLLGGGLAAFLLADID